MHVSCMANTGKQGRTSSRHSVTAKSRGKKPTKDESRTMYEIGAETGRYRTKSASGRMVSVRNATTGQYVLAPAVKANTSFRSRKATVVREVISERRGG